MYVLNKLRKEVAWFLNTYTIIHMYPATQFLQPYITFLFWTYIRRKIRHISTLEVLSTNILYICTYYVILLQQNESFFMSIAICSGILKRREVLGKTQKEQRICQNVPRGPTNQSQPNFYASRISRKGEWTDQKRHQWIHQYQRCHQKWHQISIKTT